jgi:hypothetical protein
MPPPGAIFGLSDIDDETECIISLTERFRNVILRSLDEPGYTILEVPALIFMSGIGDVVDIVMNFGAEVEIVRIPGNVVAGIQIVLRRRFITDR